MTMARVWRAGSEEIGCRIAIAGDYLPCTSSDDHGLHDWVGPTDMIAPYFGDVDLLFVNLECPVGVRGLRPRRKLGLGSNLSAPDYALEYLRPIRAGVISISNNHIYDFGKEGMKRTRSALLERGMVPLGSGRRLDDDPDVFVWESPRGLRVGFWAAGTNMPDSATMTVAGVEPASPRRASLALRRMTELGATCSIALLHAGCEKTNRPDPSDLHLMNSLAAEGFDIVAACHSHRISGYSAVGRASADRPGFCFYGLGSLSSGIMYSPLEREGLIVVAGIDSRGALAEVEVRPVSLQGFGWGCVPDVVTREAILARFSRLSGEIADSTYSGLFYKDMSAGLLSNQFRDIAIAFRRGGFRGILKKLSRLNIKHLKRLAHRLFDP